MSGSGISWAICKSAPRSRQIAMPAPHRSVFTDEMPFLLPNQQSQSTEGNILCLQCRIYFMFTFSEHHVTMCHYNDKRTTYSITYTWTTVQHDRHASSDTHLDNVQQNTPGQHYNMTDTDLDKGQHTVLLRLFYLYWNRLCVYYSWLL